MMFQTRENIKQEIQRLDDDQLEEIGRFIEFLKWKSQRATKSNQLKSFANLYQKFAQEDRELAEVGMTDYSQQLEEEDQA
ncbi:hypothetical protein [Dactylococcopsis salina]|uniref:DUF2281 domain-containing protein n=1 Tax=Dactylococcopsis salina (strain PCC 8305) TaxID=13035 RepID=K9YU86_DACS8|nr:hypothetical protein [Dactylococcopsis salina]AFZ50067.1 hypothetical protein Dacsa_1373 [Dactylococcopsis salina PCC 8305]